MGTAAQTRRRSGRSWRSATTSRHSLLLQGSPPSGKLLIHSIGEMSEWLKEHAWKACVGETLPRVRIPLSPPINFCCCYALPPSVYPRCHDVATTGEHLRRLQQPNRAVRRPRTEMHVTLRRRQVGMSRQSLIARAGAPNIAKWEQNVWRGMCGPLFGSPARCAARRTKP